jgi:DNA-binding MarR family transcriptional regulator
MSDAQKLDNQLCFALYAASRAVTSAYQPALDALDLTYPQYLVLMVLWEEDGARVSRIGERLFLDSATLTPLLKRLAARDLVERRRSQQDERVVEVYLTAEGKRMKRRAADVPTHLFERSQLSARDLGALRNNLQRLTKTLHARS